MHIAGDGTWLATTGAFRGGGDDPVVRIWDPATDAQLRQFDTGHQHGVRQVHVAPDSSYFMAIGPASVVVLWVNPNFEMAAIRFDRDIQTSVLSTHNPCFFLLAPAACMPTA